MERKFYPENFENFLKGHADQFKLTPSKKVWHGIYNDLHPGRRWPSIAMSMVLLFTLVTIGHLNTNNGHTSRIYNIPPHTNSLYSHVFIPTLRTDSRNATGKSDVTDGYNNAGITPGNDAGNDLPTLSVSAFQPSNNVSVLPSTSDGSSNNSVVNNKNENPAIDVIENKITKTASLREVTGSSQDQSLSKQQDESTLKNEVGEVIKTIPNGNKEQPATAIKEKTPVKQEPQANAKNIRKPSRVSNVTWTYYVSPSLSYRNFSDSKINDAVTQKPAIGYEGGVAMSFNIYKKLQFTAGLQLNYSGYVIHANNTHPIIATLVLNAETQGQYSVYSALSQYGNRVDYEFTKLKNYSLQVSLPVGLQYDFGSGNDLSFGIKTTFQPSLMLGSKAYILSEDKRNYLTNPELLRKWNLNTDLSTYLSFSSSTLRWQVGPQVRYQYLSTYTNRYPVKEHLINYGIRIGISKAK